MATFCTLKLILIGESGVGKSSLLIRFVHGIFRERTTQTVVVDLKVQTIQVGGRLIKLEIWDTAGQERFKAISREYYRNADGVILMYDVTVIETYYKMSSWLADIRKYSDGVAIIVGNKNEDPESRTVQSSVVKSFATEEGLEFIETSVKTGNNVNQVFEILVRKIMEQRYPTTLDESPITKETEKPSTSKKVEKSDNVIRLSDERVQAKRRCC